MLLEEVTDLNMGLAIQKGFVRCRASQKKNIPRSLVDIVYPRWRRFC
jgi:hypothetical protein